MLSLKQLADCTLRFMRFSHGQGAYDVLVAFADTTMVAVQWVDRNHDPRTGYAIRAKQPVSTSPVEYVLIRPLLADLSFATSLYDEPLDSEWRKNKARGEIEWAFECHAKQLDGYKIAPEAMPVWALIVESIPDPNTEPTIIQPEPAKKAKRSKAEGKVKQILSDAIARHESPVIGTEEESNEGEEKTQTDA
jgi:hypothetical protein